MSIDEELAEKLNQDPKENLDTVVELEEEDADEACQEQVTEVAQAPPVTQEPAAQQIPQKPAKVPKPKKRKQPKKTEIRVKKATETKQLSRPKIVKVPKKKTRVLPFSYPVLERAIYAEVEEFQQIVQRPMKETKTQVLIEAPEATETVTEITLNLNLGAENETTATVLQLDGAAINPTNGSDSESDSDSDGSSDDSSSDSQDSSEKNPAETFVSTELQLDLEPITISQGLSDEVEAKPVAELDLQLVPVTAQPETEDKLKKTKKKVKKIRIKEKDPNKVKTKKKATEKVDDKLAQNPTV